MIGAPIHSFQNEDIPTAGDLDLEGFTSQASQVQSAASAALRYLVGRASGVGSDSSTTLDALQSVGISARYIKLLQPSAGYMNIADVLAYSTTSGPNIALGATVSASTLYSTDYPLSSLTDGNSNNWTSTNRDSDAGWFLIDLGSVKSVTRIIVINRTDCCQARANGVIVSLMNNSQTTVFTAHPFVDRSGNTLYADLRSRDSLAYSKYIINPPQQQVDGS